LAKRERPVSEEHPVEEAAAAPIPRKESESTSLDETLEDIDSIPLGAIGKDPEVGVRMLVVSYKEKCRECNELTANMDKSTLEVKDLAVQLAVARNQLRNGNYWPSVLNGISVVGGAVLVLAPAATGAMWGAQLKVLLTIVGSVLVVIPLLGILLAPAFMQASKRGRYDE
jgi:hypothetical protein